MEPIRGYRVGTEPTPEPRGQSIEYLRLTAPAAHALQRLRDSIEYRKKEGLANANCLGREDEFTGDPLPSDEQAQRLCTGCPVFKQCEEYRDVAKPAYGVYAGVVRGRSLEERAGE